MSIDFKDAEKIIETGSKKPIKTVIIVVILLVLAAVYAWTKGYFSEKGKQQAGTESLLSEEHLPKQEGIIINQQTEGDQSPTIISGNSTINYGPQKAEKP